MTPDAAGDTDPGDIRNATVTFVDRDNGDAVENARGVFELCQGQIVQGDLRDHRSGEPQPF